MSFGWRTIFRLSCLVTLVSLLGCASEQVASDLDQKQANEIVATLADHGISSMAKRGRGSTSSFSVEVDRDYYQLAISVLHAQGLPRAQQPSVEEITRPQGFMPSSREVEALRLDYALGAEIEEKLRTLPGIDSVKVVVRTNLLKSDIEPSASVFVAERAGINLNQQDVINTIQLLVPGVKRERIQVLTQQPPSHEVTVSDIGAENRAGVVVHRALVPFLWFFRVPEDDYRTLGGALLGCIVIGILVGGVFGFAIGLDREARAEGFTKLPAAKLPSAGALPAIDQSREQGRTDLTRPDRSQGRGWE